MAAADASNGPGGGPGIEIPPIISVDDHVIEPPHVWQSRLPARYADIGPRVVTAPAEISYVGGVFLV